jgi:hypothetical protein
LQHHLLLAMQTDLNQQETAGLLGMLLLLLQGPAGLAACCDALLHRRRHRYSLRMCLAKQVARRQQPLPLQHLLLLPADQE